MSVAGGWIKAPGESLDYTIDWTDWLYGDTIASSSWSVPTGITTVSTSFTTLTATIKLSGGTDLANYIVTNTIVTAAGRTGVRSFVLEVRTR